MSYATVGVVTGANKGIGFAIVRQLALQYPSSVVFSGKLLIYLTARDETRGEEALAKIREDKDLRAAKSLSIDDGVVDVNYHALDISNEQTIKDMAEFLKKEHPDGIDFVINNASIAMQGFDLDVVKTTIATNYYGTLAATRAFLPLLKDTGRISNVASNSGGLRYYKNEALKARFIEASTVDDASKLMQDFTAAVERGDHEANGWPSAAYAVSKAGEIAQTRAIANELRDAKSSKVINCCHPGWVVTDMTKGKGTKTPDQGAQTPVLLAIGDIGARSGEYWVDEEVKDWTST